MKTKNNQSDKSSSFVGHLTELRSRLIKSFIFLILTFLKQELLKPLNIAWIKLGELLGRIIAPIIMALIYFFILTPLSFIIRIFGKDLLKIKFSKDNSYWIKREKNVTSMDKQF